MSELIDNRRRRKELLKHMILQLHQGTAPEAVKSQIARVLGEVAYDDVVEVEQELIAEGLPVEEILRLCDIHSAVLEGRISHEAAKTAPPGHPVHTFQQENKALRWERDLLNSLVSRVRRDPPPEDLPELVDQMRLHVNMLADVEKHYQRKENLLFPFMEKHGITGPPKVMWGKHDEIREKLKAAVDALAQLGGDDIEEVRSVVELVVQPAAEGIADMIMKEEEILLPMCMDTLTDEEWYDIYRQSPEIGFCLYDPTDEWRPESVAESVETATEGDRIQLPSGSLTVEELNAILNTIPFDLTFVDKEDQVRYFTQGRERIFQRNRAILGRKVQMCHPPSSVHVVQQILDDFRAGRADRAPFWINLRGRFIHIEYFALRDKEGNYLGTLEVSQDLTEKRALQGEQRLLSYAKE